MKKKYYFIDLCKCLEIIPRLIIKLLNDFLGYEFGTCGAHGRFGPNETLCLAAYRDTSTKVVVMNEPSMEGVQKWIVPESGLYT